MASSKPNDFPKAQPPNTITMGVEVASTYELFWEGDTNIEYNIRKS